MACAVDNNAFEITPSRKRKREFDCKCELPDGLSNEGFTSTPKKETKNFLNSITRFSQNKKPITAEKENHFAGMEIKSISELATSIAPANKELENCSENPFEVIRKPPKKKQKEYCNDEANCFINSALNLEIPDKKFNPFEVKRISPPKDPNEPNSNCFVNPGLNIRAEDNILNPYEIRRAKVIEIHENGIENPALELPRMWTLGIPFAPNIGCRIDFNNIQLENLTPTKLLAENLTFSTTPTNPRVAALKSQTKETFQRSLSVISEETVDIGKELDCYQLELENSINEAKLKKKSVVDIDGIKELSDDEIKIPTDITGINNSIEYNEPKTPSCEVTKTENIENISKSEKLTEIVEELNSIEQNDYDKKNNDEMKDDENSEKSFEDSFDDDLDFKAPAPFVRAYRKPIVRQPKNTEEDAPKVEAPKTKSKSNPVANVIRRSIRKFMHPHGKSEKTVNKSNEDSEKSTGNLSTESPSPNHIFESIRHSLRRKPNKQLTKSNEEIQDDLKIDINSKDITLTERQIYRSATEEFQIEKKISIRSSLRKSTKGMKNHVMKTVFKKNVEEYQFTK